MTYNDKNFAVANKDASSGAEAHYVIIIFGLTVSRYKLTILRHSVLHSLIWPQSEKPFQDISSFSSCISFWCTEKQVVSAKALLCTSVVF